MTGVRGPDDVPLALNAEMAAHRCSQSVQEIFRCHDPYMEASGRMAEQQYRAGRRRGVSSSTPLSRS